MTARAVDQPHTFGENHNPHHRRKDDASALGAAARQGLPPMTHNTVQSRPIHAKAAAEDIQHHAALAGRAAASTKRAPA